MDDVEFVETEVFSLRLSRWVRDAGCVIVTPSTESRAVTMLTDCADAETRPAPKASIREQQMPGICFMKYMGIESRIDRLYPGLFLNEGEDVLTVLPFIVQRYKKTWNIQTPGITVCVARTRLTWEKDSHISESVNRSVRRFCDKNVGV